MLDLMVNTVYIEVEGNDGDGGDNPGDGKLERKIFFFFPLSEDASLF